VVAEQRRETALGDAHHVVTDSVSRSILGSIDRQNTRGCLSLHYRRAVFALVPVSLAYLKGRPVVILLEEIIVRTDDT
jgi:hypothetical protein